MTEDTNKEDEVEKIKKDILQSGVPCELDTLFKLRTAKWDAIHQDAYIDEDTNQLRYIDFYAFKNIPNLFQANLVIECCKSDKPWVFYGSWKKFWLPTVVPAHLPEAKLKLGIFECSHQTRKNIFEATFSYEPFKKGKGRDIFDASMKVIKALRYHYLRLKKFDQKYNYSFIRIFYPVIVFDGHLYRIIRRGEDFILSKTEYLRYLVSYKDRSYLIDIVSKIGLEDLLTQIYEECNTLSEFKEKTGSLFEEKRK